MALVKTRRANKMVRVNLVYPWYALRLDIREHGYSIFPSSEEMKRTVQEDLKNRGYTLLSEIIIEKETPISTPDRVFICASCWVEKHRYHGSVRRG